LNEKEGWFLLQWELATGSILYQVYPNDDQQDYKKFMKYTYKISDDSVIGLKLNGDINFKSGILMTDKNGYTRVIHPYDVKVYALAPGTATLKVYDGKKLVNSYKFTVIADTSYSLSSFVNNTRDVEGKIKEVNKKGRNVNFKQADIDKENNLLQKFAKVAADSKYATTNQRVLEVFNALIAHGGKVMSEKEYDKWQAGLKYDDYSTYRTAFSRLFDDKAVAGAFAAVNKTVLNNLGFRCTLESPDYDYAYNLVEIYKKNDDYEAQLQDRETFYKLYNENYDEFYEVYGDEYEDNIYKKTHLPAWIVGKDTAQ
jgi:hypothetical protein